MDFGNLIQVDLIDLFLKIVEQKAKELIEYQTGQLFKGIRSDGSKITPPYAASTKKAKARKGQPTNRVTLFDKGNYYKSFKVKPFKSYVEMTSFLEVQRGFDLAEHLRKKYGDNIEGLIEKNEEKFLKEVFLQMSIDLKRYGIG